MLKNLIIAATFLLPQTVEQAATPEKRAWGLMGRKSLSENEGMLFVYPRPGKHSLWMFNTFVDLSVAFLDANGVILEIHSLTAYPKMMDPQRPINQIDDLTKYPPDDPIRQFFKNLTLQPKEKTTYILEMPSNWFENNGIRVGDRLLLPQNPVKRSH